jgi:hypothetical protein
MAAWLAEPGVSGAAMESTGVYWWPVYHALAGERIEVCVCNAAHCATCRAAKTASGSPSCTSTGCWPSWPAGRCVRRSPGCRWPATPVHRRARPDVPAAPGRPRPPHREDRRTGPASRRRDRTVRTADRRADDDPVHRQRTAQVIVAEDGGDMFWFPHLGPGWPPGPARRPAITSQPASGKGRRPPGRPGHNHPARRRQSARGPGRLTSAVPHRRTTEPARDLKFRYRNSRATGGNAADGT